MRTFKGIEAISMVLIVGIIVSLVGAAYMWGMPIIEKRTTSTEFASSQALTGMISDKITEISNNRGGTESIDFSGRLIKVVPHNAVDKDNNSIIMQFMVDQPIIAVGTPVYLGAESFDDIGFGTGTYGISKPGVVEFTQDLVGNKYKITVKIHYRELATKETPNRGYKIMLETDDGNAKTGNNNLLVTYSKSSVLPGAAANGGDLVLTYVNLDVR